MAEVYGLYSGRDGKVRYVGQTAGAREERFKEHQRGQYDRASSAAYSWIRAEWHAGYPLECALLERCSNEVRLDVEKRWIARFPNLLNERSRNYYWYGRKPPFVPEIREYMSRFIFNTGGFRCIHYWRDLDRYSVFAYTGRSWWWLPGDGAPGWTGDIWFSDFALALEARDRFRALVQYNWFPDIQQEVA